MSVTVARSNHSGCQNVVLSQPTFFFGASSYGKIKGLRSGELIGQIFGQLEPIHDGGGGIPIHQLHI
jgi:hypothetical protein